MGYVAPAAAVDGAPVGVVSAETGAVASGDRPTQGVLRPDRTRLRA